MSNAPEHDLSSYLAVADPDMVHIISVTFVQGKNLTSRDKVGQGDPYCIVQIEDEKGKPQEERTKHKRNTGDPVWNETVEFRFKKHQPPSLTIICKDFDRFKKKDDLIGMTDVIPLRDKWNEPGEFLWKEIFTVLEGKKKSKTPEGKLQFQIKCKSVEEKASLGDYEYTHLLDVNIIEGVDVKKTDIVGESELFLQVAWGSSIHETITVKSCGAPKWNQSLYLFFNEKLMMEYKMKFTLIDKDLNRQERIGEGYIDAVKFVGQEFSGWVPLHKKKVDSDKALQDLDEIENEEGHKKGDHVGKLRITCKLTPKEEFQPKILDAIMNEYDEDHDGALNKSEVDQLFWSMGETGEHDIEFDKWFNTIDENDDGKIDKEELIKYMDSINFLTSPQIRTIMHTALKGDCDPSTSALMKGVTYQATVEDATISVKERVSGLLVKENIPTYVVSALKIMFGNWVSRKLSSRQRSVNIMQKLSERQGKKFNDVKSRSQIPSFIKLHNLDTDEIEKPVEDYDNFNDFFARGLKPETRPISDASCVSPADCRMMVFPNTLDATDIWIKGSKFTLESLFGEKFFREKRNKAKAKEMAKLAGKFLGGSLAIARLSPQDYHRWHCPVSGKHVQITDIAGALYTVNPIAINKDVDVYTENKRAIVEIDSDEFGKVVLVIVAATMVGSYRVYHPEVGRQINKGDQHGEFRFGGSTVLTLFEPGRIEFDEDLIRNSTFPIETLLKVNSGIGSVPKNEEQKDP